MIRAVIIDDEPNNITNLCRLLDRHCPEVQVAGTALSTLEGKERIEQCHPELLFLDISMPDGTGFDLLKKVAYSGFEIIFVTAFHQY